MGIGCVVHHSRSKFWSSEDLWPREPEGSIFLARAMLEAAPIILGAPLDGKEFTTEWVEDLPFSASLATADQHTFARRLVSRIFPDRAPTMPPLAPLGQGSSMTLGQKFPIDSEPISKEDWDTVRRMVSDRQNEIFPALQKRGRVTEWFAKTVYDRGHIRVFACPLTGGAMINAVPSIWNVQWPGFDHVLRNCSTNWDNPMDPVAERTHYIFLDRPQFERALDAHRAADGERSERLALLDKPEAANASAPHSNAVEDAAIYATGGAGAPSSMHLVVAELERRSAAGMTPPKSKTSIARELQDWLLLAHPKAPPLGEKGMRNSSLFDRAYRRWKDKAASE